MSKQQEKPRRLETYQCWKCQKTFQAPAGPVNCIFCNHDRLDWLTFKDHFRKMDVQDKN